MTHPLEKPLDIRGSIGLDTHPILDLADLPEVEEICAIFEGEHLDADGVHSYVYSVGGILRGRPIVVVDHATRSVRGALPGGDCIIVQAASREEADRIAAEGLRDTQAMLAADAAMQRQLVRPVNAGLYIETELRARKRH
jgi:hypothetical protein